VILTEGERQRIIEAVRECYHAKGPTNVRITDYKVEVKLVLRYDEAGRVLLTGWFECGTPEYWYARVLAPIPIFPKM